MNPAYPHLASFLAAWLHQDFDLAGDTLEDIVASFRKSASRDDVLAIQSDIAAFLAANGDAVHDAFANTFDLEVEPTGFAPTTRAFLESIYRLLGASAAV